MARKPPCSRALGNHGFCSSHQRGTVNRLVGASPGTLLRIGKGESRANGLSASVSCERPEGNRTQRGKPVLLLYTFHALSLARGRSIDAHGPPKEPTARKESNPTSLLAHSFVKGLPGIIYHFRGDPEIGF